MKDKTCCFTGHRNLSKYDVEKIKKALEEKIEDLIKDGMVRFMAGGALGFDTLAALTVIEMREKYPQIRLILVLPCKNQSEKWSEKDIETYEYTKKHANLCIFAAEAYCPRCMLNRNELMVVNSECVIAAWDGRKSGGTYATIHYAKKLNRKIINLLPTKKET